MKGIIFTTDAMLATLIFIVMLSGLVYLSSQTDNKSDLSGLYLSKVANDALVVMEKNKTLQTLDADLINETLTKVLPPSLAGRLRVETFEWNNGNFDPISPITVTTRNFNPDNFITVRRTFLVFEDQLIRYYGLAELGVGYA